MKKVILLAVFATIFSGVVAAESRYYMTVPVTKEFIKFVAKDEYETFHFLDDDGGSTRVYLGISTKGNIQRLYSFHLTNSTRNIFKQKWNDRYYCNNFNEIMMIIVLENEQDGEVIIRDREKGEYETVTLDKLKNTNWYRWCSYKKNGEKLNIDGIIKGVVHAVVFH